jgi:hypothetical protein
MSLLEQGLVRHLFLKKKIPDLASVALLNEGCPFLCLFLHILLYIYKEGNSCALSKKIREQLLK